MPISAAFTINGVANPAEHATTYGAVVSLALTSIVGADVITWEILVASEPGYPIPTITTGGTPNGTTAQFTFPADPGDTLGRSFRIKCTVANSNESDEEIGIVGVLNVNGCLPLCPGEEFERHATHGWGPTLNRFLATLGGAPIGPAGGDLAGTFPTPTVKAVSGTAGVLAVHANEFRWGEGATPSFTQAARTSNAATHDFDFTSQAPFATATLSNRNPGNFHFAISAPASGGSPGFFKISVSGTTTHQLGVYPTDTSYAALWMGAGTPSASNYALAAKIGAATSLNAATAINFSIADTAYGRFTSTGLSIGGVPIADPTETLDVVGRSKIGVGAGKVILDGLIGLTATWGAAWMGTATPSATNYALAANGTNTVVNAGATMQLGIAGTTKATLTTTGFRVGDTSAATEMLDIIGRAKIGVSTAKVFLDGYPGLTTTYGAAWFGAITPSTTNYSVLSNGAELILNVTTGNSLFFNINHSNNGRWSATGLRVGDGTGATEKLEVVGDATALGRIRANKVQSSATLSAANAHLLLENASGGQTILAFQHSSSIMGGVRSDNAGNFNWHCGASGYHQFYRDLSTSNPLVNISGTGVKILGGAGAAASEALDVVGRAKVGVNTGKVQIDSSLNAPTTEGAIWMGTATPTSSNYRLRGDASFVYLNGNSGAYISTGAGATIRVAIGDNGMRIGDSTAPTDKLEVVGRAQIGVSTAKIFLDGFPGFTTSDAAIWGGAITPSSTNWALNTNGTNSTSLNTPTGGKLTWCVNGGVLASFNATGFRIGDTAVASAEKLEIVGNGVATGDFVANSGANGKARIAGLVGSTTTHGAVYLGNVTPSATNATLYGNGSTQTLLACPGNGSIDLFVNNGGIGRWTTTGLKLGAASNPSAVLDVAGNAIIGASTSVHQIVGGARFTVRTVAGTVTIDNTTTDFILKVDTSAARTINMPNPANSAGRLFLVKDATGTASTNNITLARFGSEKFDAVAANCVLSTDFGSWIVWCDGTDWFVL